MNRVHSVVHMCMHVIFGCGHSHVVGVQLEQLDICCKKHIHKREQHRYNNLQYTCADVMLTSVLEMPEIHWTLKSLLEMLEISWNLNGYPGSF